MISYVYIYIYAYVHTHIQTYIHVVPIIPYVSSINGVFLSPPCHCPVSERHLCQQQPGIRRGVDGGVGIVFRQAHPLDRFASDLPVIWQWFGSDLALKIRSSARKMWSLQKKKLHFACRKLGVEEMSQRKIECMQQEWGSTHPIIGI